MLLADVVNTVVRETNSTDSLLIYIFAGIICLSLWSVLYISYICNPHSRTKLLISTPVQLTGAILYYYGDNIINLTDGEGEMNPRWRAANITLGLSLIFHSIPPCLLVHRLCVKCDIEGLHTPWTPAFDTITVFVMLDAVFTLTTRILGTEYCGNWILLIVFSILGIAISLYSFLSSIASWYCPHSHYKSMCRYCKVGIIAFLILLISLPFWLLADNPWFLDCAAPKSNVRLGFAAFSLAAMAVVAFFTTAYAFSNIVLADYEL